MKRFKIKIQDIVAYICVTLFILMTFIGSWQVFSRYFLNRPSAWTEEVLTYSFVWMALLAAAVVTGKREHMRLTFVIDKFSREKRARFEILTEAIFIFFAFLIFIYGGYELCQLTMTQVTPALQLHMGKVYMVMPITGLLMVFFGVCNIQDILAENAADDGEAMK